MQYPVPGTYIMYSIMLGHFTRAIRNMNFRVFPVEKSVMKWHRFENIQKLSYVVHGIDPYLDTA